MGYEFLGPGDPNPWTDEAVRNPPRRSVIKIDPPPLTVPNTLHLTKPKTLPEPDVIHTTTLPPTCEGLLPEYAKEYRARFRPRELDFCLIRDDDYHHLLFWFEDRSVGPRIVDAEEIECIDITRTDFDQERFDGTIKLPEMSADKERQLLEELQAEMNASGEEKADGNDETVGDAHHTKSIGVQVAGFSWPLDRLLE